MSFYGLLSKHYDDIFPENKVQVTFLENAFSDCPTLLDVGAGTGNTAVALVNLGHKVTTLEYDRSMSARIKEKNHDIPVVTGDMRHVGAFFSAPFDGMYCIGNTLVHLSDESEMNDVLFQFNSLLNAEAPLVIQIVNYDRILSGNIDSLPIIEVQEKKIQFKREYEREGDKIAFKGTLTVEGHAHIEKTLLYPLTSDALMKLLLKNGFTDVAMYGDFKENPFQKEDSLGLIVIAKKGC